MLRRLTERLYNCGATSPAADSAKDPVFKSKSAFGANLERSDARKLLGEMQRLTEQALATSRAAVGQGDDVTSVVTDFETVIGEISARNRLTSRDAQCPKPCGHPGFDMHQTVVPSG